MNSYLPDVLRDMKTCKISNAKINLQNYTHK